MPLNQLFTDWVTGDTITAVKMNQMKNDLAALTGATFSGDLVLSKGTANIRLGSSSAGPHGLSFWGTGGSTEMNLYYRTTGKDLGVEHSDGTVLMKWDRDNYRTEVSRMWLTHTDGIGRDSNGSYLRLSGGSTLASGPDIILYGSSSNNRGDLRHDGTIKLQWNSAAVETMNGAHVIRPGAAGTSRTVLQMGFTGSPSTGNAAYRFVMELADDTMRLDGWDGTFVRNFLRFNHGSQIMEFLAATQYFVDASEVRFPNSGTIVGEGTAATYLQLRAAAGSQAYILFRTNAALNMSLMWDDAGTDEYLAVRDDVAGLTRTRFYRDGDMEHGDRFAGVWGFQINSDGTGFVGPTGWTSSKPGTGQYLITHNLGHTNYHPVATAFGGINATIGLKSSTQVRVDTYNSSGTATNATNYCMILER